MLELNDWMVIIGINLILTAVIGCFVGYCTILVRDYRLSKLEHEVERLTMIWMSEKGNAARSKNQEEEAAFMAQAAAILKEEGDMPAKIQKIIALNPAMAMRLASKMGIRM